MFVTISGKHVLSCADFTAVKERHPDRTSPNRICSPHSQPGKCVLNSALPGNHRHLLFETPSQTRDETRRAFAELRQLKSSTNFILAGSRRELALALRNQHIMDCAGRS